MQTNLCNPRPALIRIWLQNNFEWDGSNWFAEQLQLQSHKASNISHGFRCAAKAGANLSLVRRLSTSNFTCGGAPIGLSPFIPTFISFCLFFSALVRCCLRSEAPSKWGCRQILRWLPFRAPSAIGWTLSDCFPTTGQFSFEINLTRY